MAMLSNTQWTGKNLALTRLTKTLKPALWYGNIVDA